MAMIIDDSSIKNNIEFGKYINDQCDRISKAMDDYYAGYFIAQNTVPHDPPKREKKSSVNWYVKLSQYFGVKKAIFNDPATIVIWRDNTKTVVKCGERDTYDPEKGLALCFAKRALGNTGSYYNVFKDLLPELKEEEDED